REKSSCGSPTRRPCSSKSLRRKPLFPPPHDATTGKRFRNKGQQARHVLTVNGRVKMVRRWWHSPTSGSLAPVADAVDAQHESVSPGVREMACRLNNDATNFDAAADNLRRTAQIEMSGEQLRLIVLAAGRAVQQAQQA